MKGSRVIDISPQGATVFANGVEESSHSGAAMLEFLAERKIAVPEHRFITDGVSVRLEVESEQLEHVKPVHAVPIWRFADKVIGATPVVTRITVFA